LGLSGDGTIAEDEMNGLLVRWLILTLAILFASYVLSGIEVSGFFPAFFAAALLGILNAFFRPFLIILTLPINILTLGLFTFVINALILKMASGVIPGFYVHGFWTAVFGALIISIANWLLSSVLSGPGRTERGGFIDLERKGGNRWE
jgi:putative membrane protein